MTKAAAGNLRQERHAKTKLAYAEYLRILEIGGKPKEKTIADAFGAPRTNLHNMINGVELKEESAAKCQILYEQEEIAMTEYLIKTATNTGEVRRYEPQPHIKWLGLIFDSRLSFRQHVQHLTSRGAAAAGCLRMLANTKGGLSHQNMKILYNTCILPTLSYASPVWWNGKKSQIQKIEKIQNRCLRTIMPVFTTTPIHAMQVESGVPPLHI